MADYPLYDPETDGTTGNEIKRSCVPGERTNVKYLKDQVNNSRWALSKPEWENTDEYQDRIDSCANYYEKKAILKHRYGIEYE